MISTVRGFETNMVILPLLAFAATELRFSLKQMMPSVGTPPIRSSTLVSSGGSGAGDGLIAAALTTENKKIKVVAKLDTKFLVAAFEGFGDVVVGFILASLWCRANAKMILWRIMDSKWLVFKYINGIVMGLGKGWGWPKA
jgi:hypothetical protein